MNALSMALAAVLVAAPGASAHDAHETFAAGAPGDPTKSAETVDLAIHERPDGTMSFGTTLVRAQLGEQIRFVVTNDGKALHEFRLDSIIGGSAHKA